MNTELMFSSKSDNWATPDDLFKELDKEFHFNLDPCADEYNHKCDKYFTKEQNGLLQSWGVAECSVIRLMVKRLKIGLRNVRSQMLS